MTRHRKAAERELRRAIEERRYADARADVLVFCEAAAAHAESLPRRELPFQTCVSQTLATLEWAERMVLAGKSVIASELQRLPHVHPSFRPAPTPPTLDFEV